MSIYFIISNVETETYKNIYISCVNHSLRMFVICLTIYIYIYVWCTKASFAELYTSWHERSHVAPALIRAFISQLNKTDLNVVVIVMFSFFSNETAKLIHNHWKVEFFLKQINKRKQTNKARKIWCVTVNAIKMDGTHFFLIYLGFFISSLRHKYFPNRGFLHLSFFSLSTSISLHQLLFRFDVQAFHCR